MGLVAAGVTLASAGTASGAAPAAGRSAALRLLAADELSALSRGDAGLMCRILARDAPMKHGGQPPCSRIPAQDDRDDLPMKLRLRAITIRAANATHARLDITATAAQVTGRQGRLRSHTVHDALRAVRIGGAWRLAKPSGLFYLMVGAPAPGDLAAAAATATWPVPDEHQPSVSEQPLLEPCRVPPPLAPASVCPAITTLDLAEGVDGGAVSAWTTETWDGTPVQVLTRPLTAGAGAGARLDAHEPGDPVDEWSVADDGLVATARGALLFEHPQAGAGLRAIPLDARGAVRGPAQTVQRSDAGGADGATDFVAVTSPHATTAAVLLQTYDDPDRVQTLLARLTPEGTPAGPRVPVSDVGYTGDQIAAAALPDGELLRVDAVNRQITVSHLGPDAHRIGAAAARPVPDMLGRPAVAVGDDGRVLVAWDRRDDHERTSTWAWAVDPSSVGAGAPVRVATAPAPPNGEWAGSSIVAVAVGRDGGWTLAATRQAGGARRPASVVRLDAAGRPAGPPVPVAGDVDGLAVAGDTVAWIAPPQIAGLPQVRAAPLP
jgi:hypothetical protein